MSRVAFAAALSLALPLPAHALEFGNGLSLSSDFEAEMLAFDFGQENYYMGDFELGYAPKDSSFGAYAVINGLMVDGDSVANYWAAITYSGAFGKLSVGAPRPAIDDYFNSPDIAGVRAYNTVLPFGKSFVGNVFYYDLYGITPGIRFDTTSGPLSLGVSAHSSAAGNFFDLAGRYTRGKTTFSASYERVEFPEISLSLDLRQIGVDSRLGKWTVGGILMDISQSEQRMIHAYAGYQATDRLSVTASYVDLGSSFGSEQFYGVATRYTLPNGAFGELGYVAGLADDMLNLSIGAKF